MDHKLAQKQYPESKDLGKKLKLDKCHEESTSMGSTGITVVNDLFQR